MANINKDYLVIVDVKKSSISLANGSMTFNILDKNTSNIFVNLVINTSTNELIHRFTNIENAEDYTVVMNILKPNNEYLTLEGELRDKEKAVFEFNLPIEARDVIGTYVCELLTKCYINGQEEVTASDKMSYIVKESILNDLDDVITEEPSYPVVMELLDKLSDVERYEDDVRQAETARKLAETARVEAEAIREQEHDVAMQDIEDKIIEVEGRAVEIETNIADKFKKQNDKLSAMEVVNNVQNERLVKVEEKNKKQDYSLACLFTRTDRVEINFDGNSEHLVNSKDGLAIVNSFEGQTMVNLNKEADKSLTLNGNIDKTGQSVDVTEGADGGLVDVYAQGNTMVNVCDQEDSIPLTMSYTVETGNHVAFRGEYDGKANPYVYGNTLWIDNDTEEVLTEFGETKDLRLQSSFEDNLVTEGENAGKYKVDYVSTGKNLFDVNTMKTSWWVSTNKVEKEISNVNYSILVPIKNNTTYVISCGDYYDREAYALLDENYNALLIGNKDDVVHNTVNAKYLIYYMNSTGIDDLSNIQLEEGSVATEYEPYKEYTKTLYLNSPLLEGDSIEVQGNNIVHVHRMDKVVLDGSGAITSHATIDGTKMRWRVYYDSKVKNLTDSSQIPLFCDKYKTATASETWNCSEGICQNTSGNTIFLYLEKYNDGSDESLASLRAELQASPATIVYELATPTYEVISTNDNLYIDSYVAGHLDFDSAVPISEVYFNRAVSTTVKYLKPNTQYIIQFEADNAGKLTNIFLGRDGNTSVNITFSKGLVRTSVATLEDVSYAYFSLIGIGCNISNIVVTEAVNEDFGYFQGMKSVGELEGNEIEIKSSADGQDKSNIQTIQLSEPLRGLPGGVCDKIVKIDGEWYIERNCGVFNMTGTDVQWSYSNADGKAWINFHVDDIKQHVDTLVLTEKYPWIKNNMHTRVQSYTIGGVWQEGLSCIRIVLEDWTIDQCEEYLNKNPFTAIYQLATPTYEKIDYNPLSVYKDLTHISTNSTIPANLKVKNHGFNTLLKPSTTYTIASSQGVQIFQTGATLDDCLRLYGTGTMKNVRVLEGAITDTDLIPSHFDGIESAFEQEYDEEVGKYKVEIKTVGKNLFDGIWELGTLSGVDGNPVYINSEIYTPNFIKLPTGREVTLSTDDHSGYIALRFYDRDYNFIGTNLTFNLEIVKRATFTVPNNISYMKIKLITTKLDTKLQVEEGNTATEYEPYESSTISFYLDEPLRGIGNIRDEVKVLGDKVKVTRRCGEVVLDGSEDWRQTTVTGWNKQIYEMINSTLDIKANESSTAIPNIVSDILLAVDMNKLVNHDVYGITVWRLSTTEPSFFIDVKSVTNVDRLKQWLSNNPITVVYELAEPTVELIALDEEELLLESYRDGYISFDSNIPVMDVWLEYSVAVPMLDNVLETASITDEQDFLIVDLATQLAIMQLTM